MKQLTALLVLLTALFAFAGETTKAANDLNLKPTKEQIAKAKVLNNTICPISGEKIGNMGMAVPIIYKGQVINLCCMGCPGEFAKDPEKFLKVVEKELAATTPKKK